MNNASHAIAELLEDLASARAAKPLDYTSIAEEAVKWWTENMKTPLAMLVIQPWYTAVYGTNIIYYELLEPWLIRLYGPTTSVWLMTISGRRLVPVRPEDLVDIIAALSVALGGFRLEDPPLYNHAFPAYAWVASWDISKQLRKVGTSVMVLGIAPWDAVSEFHMQLWLESCGGNVQPVETSRGVVYLTTQHCLDKLLELASSRFGETVIYDVYPFSQVAPVYIGEEAERIAEMLTSEVRVEVEPPALSHEKDRVGVVAHAPSIVQHKVATDEELLESIGARLMQALGLAGMQAQPA